MDRFRLLCLCLACPLAVVLGAAFAAQYLLSFRRFTALDFASKIDIAGVRFKRPGCIHAYVIARVSVYCAASPCPRTRTPWHSPELSPEAEPKSHRHTAELGAPSYAQNRGVGEERGPVRWTFASPRSPKSAFCRIFTYLHPAALWGLPRGVPSEEGMSGGAPWA